MGMPNIVDKMISGLQNHCVVHTVRKDRLKRKNEGILLAIISIELK